MKMSIEMPVYVKPAEGQTVYELSKEIEELLNQQGLDYTVFVVKPNGETFEVKGKDFTHIHGSIMTNCEESSFHYNT